MTNDMLQLVWVCDTYEVADDRNSEVPEWPVQDAGGRWNHELFPGQRVAYDRANVNFGIQVEEIDDPQLEELPPDIYFDGSKFYREV